MGERDEGLGAKVDNSVPLLGRVSDFSSDSFCILNGTRGEYVLGRSFEVRGGRVGNLNPANLMGLISIFVMERWRLKWQRNGSM